MCSNDTAALRACSLSMANTALHAFVIVLAIGFSYRNPLSMITPDIMTNRSGRMTFCLSSRDMSLSLSRSVCLVKYMNSIFEDSKTAALYPSHCSSSGSISLRTSGRSSALDVEPFTVSHALLLMQKSCTHLTTTLDVLLHSSRQSRGLVAALLYTPLIPKDTREMVFRPLHARKIDCWR
jgi:hypothetical protein